MRDVGRHSVVIGGSKISISIEDEFWEALKELAATMGLSPDELAEQIDQEKESGNLSSAIRIYLLGVYKAQHEARTAPAGETETNAQGKLN